MLIKVTKNWKDLVEPCKHEHSPSRREFLSKGMVTGMVSLTVTSTLFGSVIEKALADTLACPAPQRSLGALAQIFSEGGPTMGARFIGDAQAASMNASMAANYGISGQANLKKLGPNMNIDVTSPFGFTLMQGPPGYPGGAAAWQTNVLSKVSGGAHLGPFSADDGAGQNIGLLGGASPFKASQMGKDIKVGVKNTLATWANGLPAASISAASPTTLASTFSLTPPAAGLTNSAALNAASDGANALSAAMDPVFNSSKRRGFASLMNNASCAFYGNSNLADPQYGTNLFTPANIAALSSKMTVASLTAEEQGQVSAFYQSAMGVAGGVIMQFGGRDYHGQSPQTVITPKDVEEARAVVMFLAACDAAQAPGAMLYFSNGQAIASGVQAATTTINGTNSNVNAPVAQGDAGGSYNGGLAIFYDPKGAPPVAKFTGTLDTTNGNVKTDPNVGSSQEAVAGLYLSALSWINNGVIPQTAITKMQAAGVAATPSKAMVI